MWPLHTGSGMRLRSAASALTYGEGPVHAAEPSHQRVHPVEDPIDHPPAPPGTRHAPPSAAPAPLRTQTLRRPPDSRWRRGGRAACSNGHTERGLQLSAQLGRENNSCAAAAAAAAATAAAAAAAAAHGSIMSFRVLVNPESVSSERQLGCAAACCSLRKSGAAFASPAAAASVANDESTTSSSTLPLLDAGRLMPGRGPRPCVAVAVATTIPESADGGQLKRETGGAGRRRADFWGGSP